MSDRQPVGDLIDSLGVKLAHDSGDLVTAAVVLLVVVDSDGDEVLRCGWSEGMGWLQRRGIAAAFNDTESCPPDGVASEDDD